jgi:hypothetical protein
MRETVAARELLEVCYSNLSFHHRRGVGYSALLTSLMRGFAASVRLR